MDRIPDGRMGRDGQRFLHDIADDAGTGAQVAAHAAHVAHAAHAAHVAHAAWGRPGKLARWRRICPNSRQNTVRTAKRPIIPLHIGDTVQRD
ncbi:hypothetical protein [Bordetella sp. LUAb4]|uniref:hypothetical protein n=1 Tax=Bordetella sp. LUAb4 TaxID=2843195 RepID=UPI001E379CAE|nr:hypothetical protein [Bordetella sp. LUAb4]